MHVGSILVGFGSYIFTVLLALDRLKCSCGLMAIPVVKFCYQVPHSLKTFKGFQVVWGEKTPSRAKFIVKGNL